MYNFPPPNYTPRVDDNVHESSWAYLFNFIPSTQATKLQNLGISFIIIGAVSMGIEGAILGKEDGLNRDYLSFYGYEILGLYPFTLGIALIFVCRHQVYAVIPIFIFLLLQLYNLTRKLVAYSIILNTWSKVCPQTSSATHCNQTEYTCIIGAAILAGITTGFTLFTMYVIKQVATPQRQFPVPHAQPISYIVASSAQATNQ
ncbi:unnamed protein product [Adineta ricciae]|uniref:Uncharacterized protein n=1 Tax=Adineta ricciae TaxID=249248 RepID=A0A815A5H5_ADIRI|nr:unnamed protein product [Adineta ricciae]CAF1252109.1 unnamed protein product [Adineta ricciae]